MRPKRDLMPEKPLVPPRSVFADGAHFAAFLTLLDAGDRYHAATVATDMNDKIFYALWAKQSVAKVPLYVRQSKILISPHRVKRPEFSLYAITHQGQLLAAKIDHLVQQVGGRSSFVVGFFQKLGNIVSFLK